MRIPILAANWKMYKTAREAVGYVRELNALLKPVDGVEVVVAAPFPMLAATAEAARNTSISVAAQNLYFERDGAFTGEVSAAMIQDTGAEFVIIGHSERRRLFGDTDEWVHRKLRAALGAGLTPIVCIGETLMERERGETLAVLDRQIQTGFKSVTADEMAALVIAYEPVWAIGTGKNATPDDAAQVHELIRFTVARRNVTRRLPILYGGSVNAGNVLALLARPELDGVLGGGASLDADGWAELVGLGAAA